MYDFTIVVQRFHRYKLTLTQISSQSASGDGYNKM